MWYKSAGPKGDPGDPGPSGPKGDPGKPVEFIDQSSCMFGIIYMVASIFALNMYIRNLHIYSYSMYLVTL